MVRDLQLHELKEHIETLTNAAREGLEVYRALDEYRGKLSSTVGKNIPLPPPVTSRCFKKIPDTEVGRVTVDHLKVLMDNLTTIYRDMANSINQIRDKLGTK